MQIKGLNIASFDIDGVLFNGWDMPAIKLNANDVIITGRSIEEYSETIEFLQSRDIYNTVFFNPIPYDTKTRESSGLHKANTLNMLLKSGLNIVIHYEDDPIQTVIIQKNTPVTVIHVSNPLVEKENKRNFK